MGVSPRLSRWLGEIEGDWSYFKMKMQSFAPGRRSTGRHARSQPAQEQIVLGAAGQLP